MAAHIWRFLVALADWRTWLRIVSGRPVVDVVFITNMRDSVDQRRFLGGYMPPEGHFNGPRYVFGDVLARTRALDVTAKDFATVEGRERAREYFLNAVRWADERGVRVILLAAGTKRLFGPQGEELKRLFPRILFTIGDNGTTWLLQAESLRALQSAGFVPGASRVCVIGPTGLLGESMVAHLVTHGYDVVGLCSSKSGVRKCKVPACTSFEEVGKVDAVIACTHADTVCLTPERVNVLRKEGCKLLVVDVAEPSNLKRKEYLACRGTVIRQDAGNAYSPRLQYVLGAASYKLFRLTQGVTFGCFAEAMTIGAEILAGNSLLRAWDWFTVSTENIRVIEGLFVKHGFGVPSPRCFGRSVDSFELDISQPPVVAQAMISPVRN